LSAEGLVVDDRGVARCGWATSTDDYMAYHDAEWGVVVHGETGLYERMTLEAFQSGLSWLTILRKREGFRSAFAGFDADTVAAFGEPDFERLMADTSIVRNRLKIRAAITNAQAVVRLRGNGGLDELFWSFAPAVRRQRRTPADIPATSAESIALAKVLKRNGFVFVGPTTMYAAMQACGLVDDHLAGCHRGGG
jgi:DNA-3-methyladenine glycosylase I